MAECLVFHGNGSTEKGMLLFKFLSPPTLNFVMLSVLLKLCSEYLRNALDIYSE